MAFYLIITVHLILCLALVILVLLQQGKGADMGAAFGSGGSNTLFGAGGATSLIVRVTTILAVMFMVTSVLLVKSYSAHREVAVAGSQDALSGSVMAGAAEKKAEPAPAEAKPEAAAPAAEQPKAESAPAPAPVEENSSGKVDAGAQNG